MSTMVVRMECDPRQRDAVLRHLRDDVAVWAQEQAGFIGGSWHLNEDATSGLGLVEFETAEAAEAAAQGPRRYTDPDRMFRIASVEIYETVAAARRSGESADAVSSGPARRTIGPGEGRILGPINGVRDRFLVDSQDWGGGLAVVEHLLAPHAIAAPVHRHSKEDEFSYVLEGRVWFQAAGEEFVADAGDLVFKPRGEWHTFWNAAGEPARVLEMISPGGLEEAFKIIDEAAEDFDLDAVIAPYGCQADMDATGPIMERHGLTFG